MMCIDQILWTLLRPIFASEHASERLLISIVERREIKGTSHYMLSYWGNAPIVNKKTSGSLLPSLSMK